MYLTELSIVWKGRDYYDELALLKKLEPIKNLDSLEDRQLNVFGDNEISEIKSFQNIKGIQLGHIANREYFYVYGGFKAKEFKCEDPITPGKNVYHLVSTDLPFTPTPIGKIEYDLGGFDVFETYFRNMKSGFVETLRKYSLSYDEWKANLNLPQSIQSKESDKGLEASYNEEINSHRQPLCNILSHLFGFGLEVGNKRVYVPYQKDVTYEMTFELLSELVVKILPIEKERGNIN